MIYPHSPSSRRSRKKYLERQTFRTSTFSLQFSTVGVKEASHKCRMGRSCAFCPLIHFLVFLCSPHLRRAELAQLPFPGSSARASSLVQPTGGGREKEGWRRVKQPEHLPSLCASLPQDPCFLQQLQPCMQFQSSSDTTVSFYCPSRPRASSS